MSSDDLTIEQSWRGHFWLPDKPQEPQQGFLTYTPDDGVTLRLVAGFDDRQRVSTSTTGYTVTKGPGRFPIILGAVGSGKPVTLVDCRITHSQLSGFMDEVRDQDISVAHVLTGVALKDPDAAVFSELAIELENLTEWNRHDEVTIFVDPSEESPRRENWRVQVEPLKPLSATVGDLTIELVRQYRQPRFDILRDRLDTTATAFSYLNIRSSNPKSMGEWFEVTKAFQDLLTPAMDTPCALLSESFTPSEELLADESAHPRHTIDVFGEHILKGERDREGVTSRKGLFTLGTKGVEFHRIVSEWLRIHADFRTTCDMIFGMRYVNRGYLQTQLVTAVAAAESLHAALGLDPPLPEEEFADRRRKLIESVPKDQREWLHQKLGENKPSLRQRLLDLAQIPYAASMSEMLPNPGAWAKATRDERNAVAHGGKNMSRDVPLLVAIVTTTTAVVVLNLLHQLGIPAERIKMALDYNRTLESAKYLANKQWPASENSDKS